MRGRKISFKQFIYVHSNHPLVDRIIERVLVPLSYEVRSFSPTHMPGPEECNWALIVDTHSVEEWPEISIQYGLQRSRPVVILADNLSTREEQIRLIHLGVRGIIPIRTLERELVGAIDTVMSGRLWFPRSTLNEYVIRSNAPGGLRAHGLTVREDQIVTCLLKCFSNKEIGSMLGISDRTVKFHVSNILQKFNVRSRRGLLKSEKLPLKTPVKTPVRTSDGPLFKVAG